MSDLSKHIKLTMPESATTLDLVRARCVRMAFQFGLVRSNSVRATESVSRIPKTYDQPDALGSGEKYCVWHRIVTTAAKSDPRYNPLWAIDWHFYKSIVSNTPVNANSLCAKERAPTYYHFGVQSLNRAYDVLLATLHTIPNKVDVLYVTHGLIPSAAIDELASQTRLDPVAELLWRDSRNIEPSEALVYEARLAYAAHPGLYNHPSYPKAWLKKRKLSRLFEVGNDSDSLVRAPTVDGLLGVERAAVETFSAVG